MALDGSNMRKYTVRRSIRERTLPGDRLCTDINQPLFLWLFGKMTDAAGTSDQYKWFTYMFIVAVSSVRSVSPLYNTLCARSRARPPS